MIVCCAFWGGNAVAVKFAVPDLPPFGVAALRFLLSLPILVLVCRMVGQPITIRREFWYLAVIQGLFAFLQIGSFNWGTSHSAAGRSSIFINVHPLVVAPLAWLLLGEKLGPRSVFGLFAAAIGVALVLSSAMRGGGSRGDLTGDLVVLGSGMVFAVQTIVQKKTFSRIPPATLLLYQSILAIPLFLLYSGLVEGFETYNFTRGATLAVFYQGFAVSGFCFSVWLLLLGRYPAGQLATVAFVTPMFGVGLGTLLKGEELTWTLILGGLLVGFGIFLTSSDRAEHPPKLDLALPGEDAP